MDYTKEEKCFIVGVALGYIKREHRFDVGKLMNKHPEIFKDVISAIVSGEISADYDIRDKIIKLAEDLGCKKELIFD